MSKPGVPEERGRGAIRGMAKLRRIIRLLLGGGLYYGGSFQLLLARKARRGEVCVLGLHRILDRNAKEHSNSQESMILSEDVFARVLEFLLQYFQPVSTGELLDRPGSLSRPRCLITFDDGWRDNYTTAFPQLKRHSVPATIFLATGMINEQKIFWVEQLRASCGDTECLARVREKGAGLLGKKPSTVTLEQVIEYLKRVPASARQEFLREMRLAAAPGYDDKMLTWPQVLEMSGNGIDFGSHTVTHPILTYEQNATVDYELRSSKNQIENTIARKVHSFAYPNGDWDERVRLRVKEAQYECGFTTRPGWSTSQQDRYTIPRILLHDGNVTGLNGKFSPAAFTLTLTGWRS